jgi:hypothetical protein
MSGAVAAHAAYNGAGTQGLAVTNRINDTGDVTSVFWNKNDTTRQLLHGANYVEVPSQGTAGSSARNTITFDINNDVDCIGDLFLEIIVDISGASFTATSDTFDLIDAISRVEFMVGTQIWQTLEYEDLLSLYHTEFSEGAYRNIAYQLSGHIVDISNTTNNFRFHHNPVPSVAGSTYSYQAIVPLKLLTRTHLRKFETFSEQSEDGYLMAAAPNQQVRINVFTNPATNITSNALNVLVKLYARNIVMCEAERQQLSNMRVVKKVKISQNAILRPVLTNTEHTVILDHLSLYASHLIISTTIPFYRLNTMELLLNSTTYSGQMPVSVLKVSGANLGLYCNTPSTGAGFDNRSQYVFPLASTAYGGSCVPMNRFDNIRLIVTTQGGEIPALSLSVTDARHIISVTAVGYTTALYANGAASVAMY